MTTAAASQATTAAAPPTPARIAFPKHCPRCRRRRRRRQRPQRLTVATGNGFEWRRMRVSRRYGTAMLPVRLLRRAGIEADDEILVAVVRPGLLAVQLVRKALPKS